MTFELYNYAHFFELILAHVCRRMIAQTVTVIEWKHIFGCLFDEDGTLDLERELAIFEKVQKELKA